MADIHIHRAHTLGLKGARAVAAQWSETAQAKLDMACAYATGDTSDELQFSRPGVKGKLTLSGDHFELHAQLGFLLSAFKEKIESEIAHNLDELLAQGKVRAQRKKPVSAGRKKPA
ncbi:MAG: polyhydroxyalkanoic acid system family protein [Hydrogenophaga sp.]